MSSTPNYRWPKDQLKGIIDKAQIHPQELELGNYDQALRLRYALHNYRRRNCTEDFKVLISIDEIKNENDIPFFRLTIFKPVPIDLKLKKTG